MSRSKRSKRGGVDLVGKGAHYEPKTSQNKRILRQKARVEGKRELARETSQ